MIDQPIKKHLLVCIIYQYTINLHKKSVLNMASTNPISSTNTWQDKIACQKVSSPIKLHNSQMKTFVNSYVYLLTEKGSTMVQYGKNTISLQSGDLIIYPPHIYPSIGLPSTDFEARCLIVNSSFVYDCPIARNVFQAATFSMINESDPVIKLPAQTQANLQKILEMIMEHISISQKFSLESLQSLYGLFLSDLMSVIDNNQEKTGACLRSYQIFIDFNQLLRVHFREHHDITFYAEKLNISSRYLSMVVKQISNFTVSTFINRQLMLEACWLLRATDISIHQISEVLHFADQASFSKFFKRMNGVTPLHYRYDAE